MEISGQNGRVAWDGYNHSPSGDDMAFSITFNITAEPGPTIAAILGEARKAGIELTGDDQRGTFSGFNAKGSYCWDGNQIHVTVTEKPFFVSESMIRKMAVEKAPEWGLAVARQH